MKMGEKLIKRRSPEVRESLSFSDSQSTLTGDESLRDNEKLWKFIYNKRNCKKKQFNLLDLVSQGLQKRTFDVHVEHCEPNESNNSSGSKQIEEQQMKQRSGDAENSQNKTCVTEKKTENTHENSNMHEKNKLSEKQKKKNLNSPTKRRFSNRIKMKNSSLNKRVLLKEFEKTAVQESEFNPYCMSTPICKDMYSDELTITNNDISKSNRDSNDLSAIIGKGKESDENYESVAEHNIIQDCSAKKSEKINTDGDQNLDFTIISDTQEEPIEMELINTVRNNDLTLVVQETQEIQQNKENQIFDKEISCSKLRKEDNTRRNKLRATCYIEKSMDIISSSVSEEYDMDIEKNCQTPIYGDRITTLNNKISPKLSQNLIENEATSSKQRRISTIVRKPSEILSPNRNHNEINDVAINNINQHEFETEKFTDEHSLRSGILHNTKKVSLTQKNSLAELSFRNFLSYSPLKVPDGNNKSRASRIPLRKRFGAKAKSSLKLPTPCKVLELRQSNGPAEPIIPSEESIPENIKIAKNYTNSVDYHNSKQHFANKNNLTHVNFIVDQLQKSIPMSPVVVMIANNVNKSNDTIKTQSVVNNMENLPSPPAEFSDSNQIKCKKIRIALKKINITSNKNAKSPRPQNQIDKNNDDNTLLTSDDEENDAHLNETIPIANYKSIQSNKNKNEISLIDSQNKVRNKVTEDRLLYTPEWVNKKSQLKNNSKIFVPEQFPVQPVDLRKRKPRKSSLLANFKIQLSDLMSSNKNSSGRDYIKLYEKYKDECDHYNLELRNESVTSSNLGKENMKTKNVPLVHVFHADVDQSFTEILNKQNRKGGINQASFNLRSHPSLSRNYEDNRRNSDCSVRRVRDQSSFNTSLFPPPPSFLLRDEVNMTLPITESENINCKEYKNVPNKRISRYYKFQVANEKYKDRKRSTSAPTLPNTNIQNKFDEIELESELNNHCNNDYNKPRYSPEFPLPPAEAYDRSNEVIIDIPQSQDISGYASTFFKNNKKKNSLRNRYKRIQHNSDESSSSSNSPKPTKTFRQHIRLVKKISKSMPLLQQKSSKKNGEEINSMLSSASTTSRMLNDIQLDLQANPYIYDDPQEVQNLWKKSIKKKADKETEKNIKTTKRSRNRKKQENVDPLKKTYLNLTENHSVASSSLNLTNGSNRRRLYNKGNSDIEESFDMLNDCSNNGNTTENNIRSKNINNKVTNSSRKSNIIFNNIGTSSVNTEDDFIFKKPVLPAPKAFKRKHSSKNDNYNISKPNSKVEIENGVNSKNSNNTTNPKISNEVQKLLKSMPRSYMNQLNNDVNDVDEAVTSAVRRSNRRPAPRRILKYSKYLTNYESEIVPSLTQYDKIVTSIYKREMKQEKEKKSKARNKQNKEYHNQDHDRQENEKKTTNKGARSIKFANHIANETILAEIHPNTQVDSPECVQGVEIPNSNHFAEKQNNKTTRSIKKKNLNKNLTHNEEQNSKNCANTSNDITQIVDSLKHSFSKFEPTILTTVTENINIVQQQNQISVATKLKIPNNTKISAKSKKKLKKKKKLSNDMSIQKESFETKHQEEPQITDKIIKKTKIINKNNDCADSSVVTIDDNLSKPSDLVANSNFSEAEDFFHWVKQLAQATAGQNNNRNSNNSSSSNSSIICNDDNDVHRFFADDNFRITDIHKMQLTEVGGVAYIFYKEILSKNMGFIKFKPGSKKPKARSKTYNLHFLFLFGVLEFYIEGELHHSKAGNFISIPKRVNYNIINSSNEVACLFFIKATDSNTNE